jgi:spore germination cell wall hydrolase CwlJ-like protein
LTIDNRARATACALAGGLVLGSTVGIVLGGAYWAGDRAQSVDRQARINRLAEAAAQGFSEHALQNEAQAMGPGALALAQRRDPLMGNDDAQRAKQTADLTARLGQSATAVTLQARLTQVNVPAARPFHFASGDALGSTRDLDCLADAVYYEARGETPAGQAAVAQVVLNRVRHPAFPKSVCGVVFQGAQTGDGCQFSFACDGSMRHEREAMAWRRSREVASRALAGSVMSSIGNATHFHVVGLQPGWGPRLLKVAQIGLHVFYRFGGGAGAAGSFTASPRHSAPGSAMPAPQVDLAAQTTADGRPMGQYILASATVTSASNLNTGAAPVAASATAAGVPAAAKVAIHETAPAAASAHAAEAPAPAKVVVAKASVTKVDTAPKAKIETDLKTETSDTGAKPSRPSSVS